MKPIITVKGLSKRYHIGARQESHGSLRESLVAAVSTRIKRLRRNNLPATETIWALNNVSFEVQPGEVVGVIGRNGAGKSTLLKILSRIVEPTSGRVELYGRVGSLLEVGTGFHPELTGRENVFLNGAILGMARREIARKFDEIVAFSEINKFVDTPVKFYSSGMYMRLAFAVAAHLDPEILMVDEVLAVGDLAFQKKCMGKMKEASRQGRTVLFVSHGMEAIRKLCDRGILFEQGQIIDIGETESVLSKYVQGGTDAQAEYPIAPPSSSENVPGAAYKLVVEDTDGNPTMAVPVGRPWQVRVYFTITRKTEHFIIGVGLLSDETPVRTSWSTPQTVEPGEYQAVFREETVILGSGYYNIIVGLSAYEQAFHYVENAGVLEIADFSMGVDLVKVSKVGFILNPLKVEIQKSV